MRPSHLLPVWATYFVDGEGFRQVGPEIVAKNEAIARAYAEDMGLQLGRNLGRGVPQTWKAPTNGR